MGEPSAPLAGRRIGYLVRWSTPGQTGNYRGKEQDEAFPQFLAEQGAIPVPYKEGAISGRDLTKRDRALALLADVNAGTLDGFGAWDVKRITRDDTGLDAGRIIRACKDARALIVTYDRAYSVWLRKDRQAFLREAHEAGADVMQIRDTFWQGKVGRMKREPFWITFPPVGYTRDLVEVQPGPGGGPVRVKRVPRRDDAFAPAMAELVLALDRYMAIGEVVAHMNRSGHVLRQAWGKRRGDPARWRRETVKYILTRPWYVGEWEYGLDSDPQSEIWDLPNVPAAIKEERRIRHAVPDLAWFSKEDVARWRAKFIAQAPGPRPRGRKHDHWLRGVLACPTCGATLIGIGQYGYRCQGAEYLAALKRCEAPGYISEDRALDVLWSILPKLLDQLDDWQGQVADRLRAGATVEHLEAKASEARASLDAEIAEWYPPGQPRHVPEAIKRRLEEWQREVEALDAQIAQAQRAGRLTGRRRRIFDALIENPARARKQMPPAEQGAFFRDIVADVRIRGISRGAGRRFEVLAWRNLMVDSDVSENASRWVAPYLGIT